MKKIEELGLRVPKILLPKNIDLKSWSVIACDQYTQDKEYWKNVEKNASGKPSTLNLILPEIYLNSPDKTERIANIRKSMRKYLDEGVFANPIEGFIYVERKTSFGRTRKGLVAEIDLETYEWKPFSKANIRATEATIVERIPPRMEIRRGAPLELPHIMLLVNDKDDILIGVAGKIVSGRLPVYNGELMCNGGYIKGWTLENNEELSRVAASISKIADKNTLDDGSTFLFAVGDGNHSLATAKAVWDEHKSLLQSKGATDEEISNCPVRYALVEIVNIYDKGLTFEPIHRVIFNADNEKLISFLKNSLDGTVCEVSDATELEKSVKHSSADFGFAYLDKNGKQKYVLLKTNIKELAVAKLQPKIDSFIKDEQAKLSAKDKNVQNSTNATCKIEIDYIHGADEVIKLGNKIGTIGILLPPIEKDSFFETINKSGPLPRKSFSMGEADEKRFYLECRMLF